MMVRDWAHAAFQAASRRDLDGAVGVLTELARQGRHVVEEAMRLWMDRTVIVMTVAGYSPTPQQGVSLALEMEADSTGELTPISQVTDEQSWAGRLFVAHTSGDDAMWAALMSSAPPTADGLIDYALVLLRTMTTTADAYAEQCCKGTCCMVHAVDVEHLTAQIAVSHNN